MGEVMLYKTNIAQDPKEFAAYCEILKGSDVRLYLEIGSKFGGSLWQAATSLPVGSRIVSVDLPNGTKAWRESSESLKACVAELNNLGYDARIIWGDSKAKDVLHKVQLAGPYDAIMIDADHRLPGLTKDWLNYGPMSRNIVAFHDIGWRRAPDWHGVRIDVPEFWSALKPDFRHQEIKLCPTGKNNGIGVLWKD